MHSGEEVIPPMDTGMQLGRRMVTEWPNNDQCLLLCVNIGHFIKFSPSSPVTPVAPHIPARPSTLCCHAPCSFLPLCLFSCCYICLIGPSVPCPRWKSTHYADVISFHFPSRRWSTLNGSQLFISHNRQSNDSGSEWAESWLQYRLLVPTLRVSDSVGLGGVPRIYIFNKFLGDADTVNLGTTL